MKLKPLKTIQQLDYSTSRIQGYLQEFLAQLMPNPFITGIILDVSILTTDTPLNHGLQTEPSGWFIIDKNANANVWKISQSDKQLVLRASAAVTVRIWVF